MPRISVARGNKRVNQWFATELKVCSRQSFKTLFPSAWLRSSSVIFANVTSRTWKRTRYWQRGQNCVSTVEIWWPRQTRDDRSKKHKESNRDGGAEQPVLITCETPRVPNVIRTRNRIRRTRAGCFGVDRRSNFPRIQFPRVRFTTLPRTFLSSLEFNY